MSKKRKINLSTKNRKVLWDSNFWKESIPPYEPFDRFSNNENEKLKMSLGTSSRNMPKKPTEILRKLTNQMPEALVKEKEELENIWTMKSIPEPLRSAFRNFLKSLPRQRALKEIAKEVENLKFNRSNVENALKTISSREESLLSLIEMNSYLEISPGWESFLEVKVECAELLNAHRMLTLATIESIENWKSQVLHLYPFVWKNLNYLEKIHNDTQFLIDSEFAKTFKITDRLDCLLLDTSEGALVSNKDAIKQVYTESNGQSLISLPIALYSRLKLAQSIVNRASNACSESLEHDFLDHLIGIHLNRLVKEVIKEQSHEKTFSNHAIEAIGNDLVDIVVKEYLRNIHESTKIDMDIADLQYSSLLEQNIRPIIEDVSIEELTENSVQISISQLFEYILDKMLLALLKRKLSQEVDTSFDNKICNNSDISFEPIASDSRNIGKVLHKYYAQIPEAISVLLKPLKILLKEMQSYNNPCMYWILKNTETVGLLVYSENPYHGLSLVINHISCINYQNFKAVLTKTEEFLKKLEHYKNISLELSDTDPEINKILKKLKYKTKTTSTSQTMFVKETKALRPFSTIQIENKCSVIISEEEIKENKKNDTNTIMFGERLCLLKSLLTLSENSIDDITTVNRLQRDLIDVLEIIDAYDNFSFENIVEFPLMNKKVCSLLELYFNWKGFSIMEYQPLDTPYVYYKFHSEVKYRLCESAEIYTVPTTSPSLSVFFIVLPDLLIELKNDLRAFKTDLFYKVEGLLKAADFEEKDAQELWVPAFHAKLTSSLYWLEGFNLSDLYVKEGKQEFSIKASLPQEKRGVLRSQPVNVISSNFIFGVIHHQIYSVLEIPILATLVQEKDWVK